MKNSLACLIIVLVLLTRSSNRIALAQEEPLMPLESQISGMIEGSGTQFVITDSQYLNVTLESSQPVHAVLESVPTLVTLHLAASAQATSTEITLGGFVANTTYYLYQDDYHHLVEFKTDANGRYQYTQDLSQPRLIFIQPVPSTIFINSATGGDCAQIGIWDGANNTCTLTGPVTEMIQIDSDGITLNGNNHLIQVSTGQLGILLSNRTGVMIENVRIEGANTGIYFNNVTDTTVSNTTVSNGTTYGMRLLNSTLNTLVGNTVSGVTHGFRLQNSNQNQFTDNTILTSSGVFLFNSNENIIANNAITSAATGAGIALNSSTGTVVSDNTIVGADIGIGIVKPSYISYPGGENSVIDNTISNTRLGIMLNGSSFNTITGNTISGSSSIGLYIYVDSNSNNVADNQLLNNFKGVSTHRSSQNQLIGNTITGSRFYGIEFNSSSNSNHVTGNVISGSERSGIRFTRSSNGNVISDNTLTDNYRAIDLTSFAPDASNDNQVYHNNFIDNTYPPQILAGSGNIFNLGAPVGGNYWSRYDTAVEGCDDMNHDRFCDAPYTFYGGQDNLPWTFQGGWTNQPPAASAGGPYAGSEGESIPLSGAGASDPDGDTLTYSWAVNSALCSFDDASLLKPNLTCSDNGSFTASLSVDDGVSPAVSSDADITVNNVAPIASLGNDGPIDEGGSANVSFSGVSDPSSDDTAAGFHYAFDCNGGSLSAATYASSGTSDSISCPFADDGNYTVRGKIIDKDDGSNEYTTSVTVNNVAPILGAISADQVLVPVNTAINTSADFSDPGILDTHTASWDWGDGTTADTVTQGAGSGSVSDSHSYSTPGVYTIKLTVKDKDNADSNESIYEFVVVYDPSVGFVTGGGWIDSPEGACKYAECTNATTGKANFGFVAKYKKGANVPDGNTEFQFKTGDLNFHSTSYEWLVVAGQDKAKYKGEGAINGDGEYGFMLTAQDNGNSGDTFRIKIWDKESGDVVYDNKSGVADDGYDGTEIADGNIVIHTGGKGVKGANVAAETNGHKIFMPLVFR